MNILVFSRDRIMNDLNRAKSRPERVENKLPIPSFKSAETNSGERFANMHRQPELE